MRDLVAFLNSFAVLLCVLVGVFVPCAFDALRERAQRRRTKAVRHG